MSENIKTVKIADGLDGCYIRSTRFKTSRVSVAAYLPLEKESVAAYSMLALLLSNGCADYPEPRQLNSRLDTLYGAAVEFDCVKSGDSLMLVASAVFVDDRYLPEPVFSACAQLLESMLFRPAVDEVGFLEKNFEREKRIQLEYIDGEINDKRTYARNRLVELMCANEPFGLSSLGTREAVEKLTRAQTYEAWQSMLKTAHFRVSVTAADEHPEVFERFATALGSVEGRCAKRPVASKAARAREQVQTAQERFPVAQGKLVMGFRTDISGSDADSYKMMVFCDVFGGGPYSRLFSVVREKMSLCYYCAARAVRRKGIMVVDSGVEFANMDKTYEAVLDQLEIMKRGEFDDEALEASKLALCGSLKGVYDSQAVVDRWYAERLFDDKVLSPMEVAELVKSVTRDDVIEAARGVHLDTVYRLLGKEEG